MSRVKSVAQVRLGLYRHEKSKREYLVIGTGVDSSSAPELRGNMMVAYRPREPKPEDPPFYVRPVAEFLKGFTLIVQANPSADRCRCEV